jgi:hypothetical protein
MQMIPDGPRRVLFMGFARKGGGHRAEVSPVKHPQQLLARIARQPLHINPADYSVCALLCFVRRIMDI